jgi:glycosyltransferase involved in cell wall biosynthesis
MEMKISAYVIVYNNQQYLPSVLQSILDQDIDVLEIIIIDDGSDPPVSSNFIKYSPKKITLHRNNQNMGRGYSRYKAMKLCKGEFILCVDSTNTIEKQFLSKLLYHFKDANVACVYGQLYVPNKKSFINRWKARHLLKQDQDTGGTTPTDILITYGTIIKKRIYDICGGFNPQLTYNEDKDLGVKFTKHGFYMIGDSKAKIYSLKKETLLSLMERYSRWYMDTDETPCLYSYLHNIKASLNPMFKMDLKELDILSGMISLMSPHFQFYYSILTYIKMNLSNCKYTNKKVT